MGVPRGSGVRSPRAGCLEGAGVPVVTLPPSPRSPGRTSRPVPGRGGPRVSRCQTPGCPAGSSPPAGPSTSHWSQIIARCFVVQCLWPRGLHLWELAVARASLLITPPPHAPAYSPPGSATPEPPGPVRGSRSHISGAGWAPTRLGPCSPMGGGGAGGRVGAVSPGWGPPTATSGTRLKATAATNAPRAAPASSSTCWGHGDTHVRDEAVSPALYPISDPTPRERDPTAQHGWGTP